ncbi:MAG: hypothetical protein J7604_04795 [Sporocytophaga sp.]|uniref:hypothetical protein n=1 Tax=Sporocytophaga sp. TaxID=2231183 RepID=UPI001B29CAB3|nr:hypothetical protein [Sporocytophaga sp.]MBO9699504.1 hypothetical protein [Sporocytophaga sp.]
MMSEDSTYSQVEDYIHGRLTTEELLAFEAKLSNDPDLARQVKLHELADNLVIENRLLEVSAIIKNQSGNSASGKIKYTAISIFAAATLGVGGWLLIQSNSENSEQVLMQSNQEIIPENKQYFHSPSEPLYESGTVPAQKNSVKTKTNQEEVLEEAASSNTIDSMSVKVETTVRQEKDLSISNASEKSLPSETTNLNPCEKTELSAAIKTIETCEGEEQGAIKVQQIKGGIEPYSYSVFDGEEIKDAAHLQSGSYKVVIVDGNGCRKTYDHLTVKDKNCPKDYSFNPFIEENWEIPSHGKAGKLLIYDASGNIYFEKQIVEGEKDHWSGEGKTGEIKPGYYIFVIDRGKGSLIQGSVTIVK